MKDIAFAMVVVAIIFGLIVLLVKAPGRQPAAPLPRTDVTGMPSHINSSIVVLPTGERVLVLTRSGYQETSIAAVLLPPEPVERKTKP